MANRIARMAKAKRPGGGAERRAHKRLPIKREVRYKVRGRTAGSGETIDISSGGLLISTESPLKEKDLVELAIDWPARLNGVIPLKLVVFGCVVRAERKQAAITIDRYEFRTRAGSL